MSIQLKKPEIEYPDSDGQPMADNTVQFRWIVTLKSNLDLVFIDNPQVFVAGDLLWYPVEGHPEIRQAPDVLVAFGRPRGERGSYRQWEEGGIAPQVVFEILSPGNRPREMIRKFTFFEQYGVEEYYLYDPHLADLTGYLRNGPRLEEIPEMIGWVSPRLGCRFNLVNSELEMTGPKGKKFLTFVELGQRAEQAEKEREQTAQKLGQAQEEVERLREQLRGLGVEPKEKEF